MQIILVRHAKALDKLIAAEMNLPDADRELTKKGSHDFKKFIKCHRHLFESIDEIYSSPYLRAYQTAEIIRKKIHFEDAIVNLDFLVPDADVKDCLQKISKIKHERIVLVSHEPFLSLFVSETLKVPADAIKIKKGGIVVLNYSENKFTLEQFINP